MKNNLFQEATEELFKEIGQGRIVALATSNGEGVACRTVDLYTYNGEFYFNTENHTNKYAQMKKKNKVALSVDAIQITGIATFLEHPTHESNKKIAKVVEDQLPNKFQDYKDDDSMRLIRVSPEFASYIFLNTGKGHVINFKSGEAYKISR